MTIYLDESDLIAVAAAILDGPPAVRDEGLLASAAGRPQAAMYGTEAYADIHQKAAALHLSAIQNHALSDGNKRLGWVAVRLFYAYNHRVLRMDEDAAYDLVMSIAAGSQKDVPEVAALLAAAVQ